MELTADARNAISVAIAIQDIAQHDTAADTRQRAAELAVKTFDCRAAALWHGGAQPRPAASTDPGLTDRLHALMAIHGPGPVGHCLRHQATAGTDDLRQEQRWPALAAALRAGTALRSLIACPLTAADQPGAVVLFCDTPGYFTPERAALAAVFAAHLGLQLRSAQRAEQISHLGLALQTNRRIGIAIGILMAQRKLSEPQAFDLLRAASQRGHVKMRDLADYVLDTGTLP